MKALELEERLAAVESDCAPYLKEGETPADRIKRALGDADSLMNLYRDVMAERDALRDELERIKALPPVAWLHIPKVALDGKVRPVASTMKYDDDYGAVYSERIPLYALGSKTA